MGSPGGRAGQHHLLGPWAGLRAGGASQLSCSPLSLPSPWTLCLSTVFAQTCWQCVLVLFLQHYCKISSAEACSHLRPGSESGWVSLRIFQFQSKLEVLQLR